MPSKAVAKKSGQELTRPTWMSGTGRGNEDVSSDDVILPRIAIIQSLSPQRKRNDEKYIEGAEEGHLFNTVTNELFTDGITVVPVYHQKEWVLWRDLDAGGGLIGSYHSEQEGNEAWANHPEKDNLQLLDTSQNYVLVLHDDGRKEEAVISMSKAARGPARQWNSMIRLAGGDRFERKYTLQAIEATNKMNQTYFNWKIGQGSYVDEATYHAAEAMYEAVRAGERGIAQDAPAESTATEEDM